jgi:CDP-diacylglycerol---glycerol-3-phosphate 3-phosphatidyltransferase
MNLPNLLTLLRIFFVPVLVAALVQWNIPVVALAIFLCAASTDLLDGYVARRWGQVTTIGTLLDPIADKLLISAALIALVQVRAVAAWMVILIVSREFAVSGLRSIAAAEGYTIQASDLGKTKMVFQVAAISLLLLSLAHPWLKPAALALLWLVLFFALVSAANYFRKFWREIDIRVKQRRRRELLHMERQQRKAARAALRVNRGPGEEERLAAGPRPAPYSHPQKSELL